MLFPLYTNVTLIQKILLQLVEGEPGFPVLRQETFQKTRVIKAIHRTGLSVTRIATRIGFSPQTHVLTKRRWRRRTRRPPRKLFQPGKVPLPEKLEKSELPHTARPVLAHVFQNGQADAEFVGGSFVPIALGRRKLDLLGQSHESGKNRRVPGASASRLVYVR